MFRKILVANRGEIAIRVIRACQDLGIASAAIYSDVDRDALHVRLADEAYSIGGAWAQESYLNIDKILWAVERSKADAIHPGYGFLSENPAFSEACRAKGITFIGPSPEAQRRLGEKTRARQLAYSLGVPVVPGSIQGLRSEAEAQKLARDMGFPLLVKAASGGGGRGMRVVHNLSELLSALKTTSQAVRSSFGDGTLYLEKLIEGARHIEVQILGDSFGNVVALGERECSVQRRHQKLIEETPSVVLDANLRYCMREAALSLARGGQYTGAGTVEFLLDRNRNFYFLEVNTRLQVEHPVTEAVTGIDMVVEQIRLASGKQLHLTQDGVKVQGAAIECRIYAEDPFNNFMPCLGNISAFHEPGGPGVRVDGAIYAGMDVPMHYDPLLSKLITWGQNRHEAIRRMRRALREYSIAGVKTTIPFHRLVMRNDAFICGNYDTSLAETILGLNSK